MGHCSCYGPTENIEFGNGFELEELYKTCTSELLKEVQPLFDEARKRFA